MSEIFYSIVFGWLWERKETYPSWKSQIGPWHPTTDTPSVPRRTIWDTLYTGLKQSQLPVKFDISYGHWKWRLHIPRPEKESLRWCWMSLHPGDCQHCCLHIPQDSFILLMEGWDETWASLMKRLSFATLSTKRKVISSTKSWQDCRKITSL